MSVVPRLIFSRGRHDTAKGELNFGRLYSGESAREPYLSEGDCELWTSTCSAATNEPVYALRKPAHVVLPGKWLDMLPANYWLVSFQGWYQGLWCDGPIVHRRLGHIVTYIPEGYPVRLSVALTNESVHKSCAAGQPDFVRGLVGSLITGIRTKTPALGSLSVLNSRFDLATYVTWVLIKKARPLLKVSPDCGLMYRQWPSGARRICQNLGWSLYDRQPPANPVVIDAAPFVLAIDAWTVELAKVLNESSAVIPASLIDVQ